MQTETQPAPVKSKRPEGREFYAVNFDLREFRQKHPEVRRADLAEKLALSQQSLDNYHERSPMSVYKAIIEAFAPNEAHAYELKLLVSHNNRPFYITKQTTELAKAYDKRRAGQKITLADGTGYYQIAPEQADGGLEVRKDDLPLRFDREVEVAIATSPDEAQIAGVIQPAPQAAPDNSEVAILIQQQEMLLAIMARVTTERDEGAIELQRQKHLLADRDATIANMSGQIARLKESIREWEELSKAEPLRGTPASHDAVLFAEEVVKRLRGTMAATGRTSLIKELDRVGPKKTGYGSFPQQSARNGNSRNSR